MLPLRFSTSSVEVGDVTKTRKVIELKTMRLSLACCNYVLFSCRKTT